MARVWSCGFETGTLGHELGGSSGGSPTIQSTQKRSGNYAMQFTQPTLGFRGSKTGLNVATAYLRFYLYTGGFPSGSYVSIAGASGTGGNDILIVRMTGASASPSGRITLVNSSSGSDVVLGTGTAVLNLNAWNLLEFKLIIAAGSGIIESKINGVVDQTFTGLTTNGRGNVDQMFWGPGVGAYQSNIYYDDMVVDNAAYCGDSKIIARSPITGGTPTYNSWTKQSGTDAGAMWDETPFSTATYCTSSTNAAAQTAVIADFSATQTGHGTETIGASDTINACKASVVAKAASGTPGMSIRRRINGVDTDTSVTLSAVDAYYETAIFTATPAQLDIAEVGAVHGTGSILHTVEDVWLLVEFSAPTGVTGTLGVTEAADTAAFVGDAAFFTGTLAVTEAVDTAAFAGNVAALVLTGTLLSTEPTDIAVIAGVLGFGTVYLDPAAAGPGIVLSNLNLTATQTAATIGNARTNEHHSAGKYYYEFTVDTAGNKQVGICSAALPLNQLLGQDSLVSVGVDDTTGWVGAGGIKTAPILTPGHTYGVAVDIDAGKAWCKNVTIVGGLWNDNATADPTTGVGGALFFVASTPPVITSSTTVSIPENTTAVMTVTSTDPG